MSDLDGKLGKTAKTTKGLTVDAQTFGNALSSALIAKGKGPLEAMGNEIDVLKAKGLETFNHLFDGIDTKPITDGIKLIISLGDQGRPSGKMLHEGIKDGLNLVIKALGGMLKEARHIFVQMEIAWVKSGLKMKDVWFAIRVAALGVGIVIAAIGVGLASVVATAAMFAAPFIAALAAATKLWDLLNGPTPGVLQGGGKKIAELGVSTLNGVGGGTTTEAAPAHAEGGLVGRPAPGEFFASVAPGEQIVPKREVPANALAGFPAMMPKTEAPAAGGSGKGVHIEHLELAVHAAGGVTDATQLSVTGLTLALERFQLASGR